MFQFVRQIQRSAVSSVQKSYRFHFSYIRTEERIATERHRRHIKKKIYISQNF